MSYFFFVSEDSIDGLSTFECLLMSLYLNIKHGNSETFLTEQKNLLLTSTGKLGAATDPGPHQTPSQA